jgi:hypothetical protein
VGGDQADLGRGLEPRPNRLPVGAAVTKRLFRRFAPARDDVRAPVRIEARHAVPAQVLVGRVAEVKGDEVVGAEDRPDRQIRAQRADRGDGQDTIAAELSESRHVGPVVDQVWRPVAVEAVPLRHDHVARVEHGDRAVVGRDLPAARAVGERQGGLGSEEAVAGGQPESPHPR